MWQFVVKFAYGHLWKHLSQNHLTRNYAFYFVWIPFGDVFVYGPRFCVWRRYVYVRGEIASTFFFNPLLWFYSYLFEKPHIKIFLLVDHRTWMFFSRVTAVSDHIKCPFKRFAFFIYIYYLIHDLLENCTLFHIYSPYCWANTIPIFIFLFCQKYNLPR